MKKYNFKELNDYMFNNKNVIKYNHNYKLKNNKNYKIKNTINNKNKINNQNFNNINNNYLENNNYFKPNEKDKLFWCFFVIVNNFNDYLLNKNNLFKIKNNFKIDVICKIKNKINELKNNKIKVKINEIENELLSDKNISLKVINIFCFVYKKSIIILNNNLYYFFNYSNDNNVYIIKYINYDYILYLEKNNNELIHDIKNTKLLIDINKPIKSINYYKLNDLQVIAEKLKINILNDKNKNKTKKKLYEEILNIIEN